MSAMKMEKNGQNSFTGNSLHKNIWYFFVKDRLDKKDIAIVHCTNEVIDSVLDSYEEQEFWID